MGIKIEDLKDTLKLKVSSLEGTVNVYSKPNVFSLRVSPNVDVPKATQNNYGVIKGGNSVLVTDGIPSINPEYLTAFLGANVGEIITGDTDGNIIPLINDLIHQYFNSVKANTLIKSTDLNAVFSDEKVLTSLRTLLEIRESYEDVLEEIGQKYLRKDIEDTAREKITFLRGIIASDLSTFTNLIASGKIIAEDIDVNNHLLTNTLKVILQADLQTILLREQMNSETFASGFLGHGMRLNKIHDRWTLELDDLIVRKTMTVYELIVQKIRYQGGQVLHSPAGGKITDVIEESDGWRCEHDSTDSFITGALVLCLRFKVGSEKLNPDGSTTFQGVKVKRYWRLVTDYGKGWFKLSKTDMEIGSDEPEIDDDVAVLGHRTDPTQLSAILIVSAGQNSPYVAHYSNINSYILEGKEVVREGNLEGIVDKDFGQLTGYGLYSNNVYLKGQLRIRSGKTVEEELDEIKDKKLLRVEKFNTPGYEFYREGHEYNHTLGIRIFEGETDVTDSINIARFVWMRISENDDGDSIWNDLHAHSGASVDITQLDLVGDTSFIVQFWDAPKNNILKTTKF